MESPRHPDPTEIQVNQDEDEEEEEHLDPISLFYISIIDNPTLPRLPPEFPNISFWTTGSDEPCLPHPWPLENSLAVLKILEVCMLSVLRTRKYGVPLAEPEVDSVLAGIQCLGPVLLSWVHPSGEKEELDVLDPERLGELGFPDENSRGDGVGREVTGFWRTKEPGKFYFLHGGLHPLKVLEALQVRHEIGLDEEGSITARIQQAMEKYTPKELDELINETSGLAGTIVQTPEEFLASEQYRSNAHVGLYELSRIQGYNQPATWWPSHPSLPSSAQRPLRGLRIVDLSRGIAAPMISKLLAEVGASVMRVTSPNLPDLSSAHVDLNCGKWNCHLDLEASADDREKLVALIKDADVVIDGYRPGALARLGFSREEIFALVRDRDRGIVHVRVNCYGWHGPWANRAGWQENSDACCGIAVAFGRAMGLEEPVPSLFSSTSCGTGIIGSVAVLHALIRRAEEGGSYAVDCALNYYNQWLVKHIEKHSASTCKKLWQRNGNPSFRYDFKHDMVIPSMIELLSKYSEPIFHLEETFENRRACGQIGHTFVHLRSPVDYRLHEVTLGYNVGTRPNGIDQPRWPDDLTTDVIT